MKFLTIRQPLFARSTPFPRTTIVGGMSVAVMILAGSIFPVFGKELTMIFSPLSLLFVSEMMGGLFVLLSFGLFPILKACRELKERQAKTLIAHGIATGILAPYLWFLGLHDTTAINAQLFSRSEMIFLILLSTAFLRETMNRSQIFSLSITALGILFVALKGFTVGIEASPGDLLIVASAATYAFGGYYVKKDLRKVHPELIIFTRAMSATAFFFLSSPFVSHTFITELRAMPSEVYLALFAYGFGAKFLGIYSFHEAIETLKITTVSMFSSLSIVGGMAFAVLYLGERLELHQVIGAGFIVAGVILMQYAGHRPDRRIMEHFLRQHHRHHL